MFEVNLTASTSHPRPFDVACNATVTGPAASRYAPLAVTAFYDGGSTWRFRFTPDAEGMWQWSTHCPADPGLDAQTGSVNCSAAAAMATTSTWSSGAQARGGVVRDPAHPHHMQFEDGSQYFLVGYEVDWLWALLLEEGPTVTAGFVDHVASFGFNQFLMSVYANHSTWNAGLPPNTPPRVSPTSVIPWAMTPAAGIDYSTLDVRFFQNWDRVMRLLESRGVVAHLMIYVGNKAVLWPQRLSEDDDLYWQYVMARYSAFPNVVFDMSKEAGSYGMGRDYVLNRLALMNEMNGHRRLVTSHSGVMWSNECNDLPITLCSMQQHFDNHTGGQWYDGIIKARAAAPSMPIANMEFMYEAGVVRGCSGSAAHDCVQTPEDVSTARMVMWDLYMAGGYGAWYNCDTAWDVIVPNETSAGYRYVRHLVDFWAGSGGASVGDASAMAPPAYAAMQPDDARVAVQGSPAFGHCLALPSGCEMVVHVRANAAFTLDMSTSGACGGGHDAAGAWSGEWFDPAAGTRVPLAPSELPSALESAPGPQTFVPPTSFAEDVVLHLLNA